MSGDSLLLALNAVINPNLIDVHIFRPALLGEDLLSVFQKLSVSLIILSEAIVDEASNPVTISSVSSAIVAILILVVFVNEVQWLLWRFRLSLLFRRTLNVSFVSVKKWCSSFKLSKAFRWLRQVQALRFRKLPALRSPNISNVQLQKAIFIVIVDFDLPNSFHICKFSIIEVLG